MRSFPFRACGPCPPLGLAPDYTRRTTLEPERDALRPVEDVLPAEDVRRPARVLPAPGDREAPLPCLCDPPRRTAGLGSLTACNRSTTSRTAASISASMPQHTRRPCFKHQITPASRSSLMWCDTVDGATCTDSAIRPTHDSSPSVGAQQARSSLPQPPPSPGPQHEASSSRSRRRTGLPMAAKARATLSVSML